MKSSELVPQLTLGGEGSRERFRYTDSLSLQGADTGFFGLSLGSSLNMSSVRLEIENREILPSDQIMPSDEVVIAGLPSTVDSKHGAGSEATFLGMPSSLGKIRVEILAPDGEIRWAMLRKHEDPTKVWMVTPTIPGLFDPFEQATLSLRVYLRGAVSPALTLPVHDLPDAPDTEGPQAVFSKISGIFNADAAEDATGSLAPYFRKIFDDESNPSSLVRMLETQPIEPGLIRNVMSRAGVLGSVEQYENAVIELRLATPPASGYRVQGDLDAVFDQMNSRARLMKEIEKAEIDASNRLAQASATLSNAALTTDAQEVANVLLSAPGVSMFLHTIHKAATLPADFELDVRLSGTKGKDGLSYVSPKSGCNNTPGQWDATVSIVNAPVTLSGGALSGKLVASSKTYIGTLRRAIELLNQPSWDDWDGNQDLNFLGDLTYSPRTRQIVAKKKAFQSWNINNTAKVEFSDPTAIAPSKNSRQFWVNTDKATPSMMVKPGIAGLPTLVREMPLHPYAPNEIGFQARNMVSDWMDFYDSVVSYGVTKPWAEWFKSTNSANYPGWSYWEPWFSLEDKPRRHYVLRLYGPEGLVETNSDVWQTGGARRVGPGNYKLTWSFLDGQTTGTVPPGEYEVHETYEWEFDCNNELLRHEERHGWKPGTIPGSNVPGQGMSGKQFILASGGAAYFTTGYLLGLWGAQPGWNVDVSDVTREAGGEEWPLTIPFTVTATDPAHIVIRTSGLSATIAVDEWSDGKEVTLTPATSQLAYYRPRGLSSMRIRLLGKRMPSWSSLGILMLVP